MNSPRSSDTLKSCLAALAFGSLLSAPPLAFLIGWLTADWQTGLIAASAALALFACLAAGALMLIRQPAAWMAALPFLLGVTYTLIPGVIPTGIDDAAVATLGGMLTFWLMRRRDPSVPGWVALVFSLAGLYPLLGGFLIGPLDELVVFSIAALVVLAGTLGRAS